MLSMTISKVKGKEQNVQQFVGTGSFLRGHSSTWLYCLQFTSVSERLTSLLLSEGAFFPSYCTKPPFRRTLIPPTEIIFP